MEAESQDISQRGLERGMQSACAPPFTGGLAENCTRFRFRGTGYDAMPKEQDGYFSLETARQVAGPMTALVDDLVRIVHVIGATQVLKSIVGDAWVMYCFEHVLLPMLVLFEDDGKADLFCARRLMETLNHHPEISKLVAESKRESRHNVTGTWLKIAGAELLVAGLNEGNVSTLTWPLVWVSEAWQHGADGLLGKAFKRTDRYPDSFKILNESQASPADTDLHLAVKKAHPVPLVWRCPKCAGEQTWEWRHWNHLRPEGFKPRPQLGISTAIIGGQVALIEPEPPRPGTYAGMKWSFKKSETEEDHRTIEEKSRSAAWECLWCGHRIRDNRAERMEICKTYSQEYRIPTADTAGRIYQRTPREVCFTLPFEAAWDNRFEKTVASFLTAKDAQRKGNEIKMRDWFLSERAEFWDRQTDRRSRLGLSAGSYETDPAKLSFGEQNHCRQMTVDCGKALDADVNEKRIGTFWFEVRDWDKHGNSRQLARGVVDSWELLEAQGRFWKVPNWRTFIDSAWMPSQVEEAAVRHFELEKIGAMQVPRCWRLMLGSGTARRLSVNNKGVALIDTKLPGVRSAHDAEGKLWRMSLYKITWANLWFEQQFESIIGGGVDVKWDYLAADKLVIVDTAGKPSEALLKRALAGEDAGKKFASYKDQLDSRYYSDKTRKYEDYDKASRPTEYRDAALMQLVGVAADGLLGHIAPEEEKT